MLLMWMVHQLITVLRKYALKIFIIIQSTTGKLFTEKNVIESRNIDINRTKFDGHLFACTSGKYTRTKRII
jgi:hypothetical protein